VLGRNPLIISDSLEDHVSFTASVELDKLEKQARQFGVLLNQRRVSLCDTVNDLICERKVDAVMVVERLKKRTGFH
jgi:hypothetical protein